MGQFKDITGRKFGLLEALYRTEPHVTPSGKKITMWMCRCRCGNEKAIRYQSLVSGETKSCGCTLGALMLETKGLHGESKTRLYNIWIDMKRRCYNPNKQFYYCYGGKGVEVCNEWRDDYLAFKEWALANGYRDDLTFDRVDSDGNYEPSNCRWATPAEQANNRGSWNQLLAFDNETHNVTEWATILGVKATTLFKRKAAGCSDKRTLTEPIHSCGRRKANT